MPRKTFPAFSALKHNKHFFENKYMEAFYTIYIMCRLSGLFPLKMQRKYGYLHLTSTKSDIAYFCLYMSAYIICGIYAIYKISLGNDKLLVLSVVMFVMDYSVILSLESVLLLMSFTSRKIILGGFKFLAEIDVLCAQLGISIDYNSTKKTNIYLCGFVMFSITARAFMTFETAGSIDIFQMFIGYIAMLLRSLCVILFVSLLSTISHRFRILNDHLQFHFQMHVMYIKTVLDERFSGDISKFNLIHYKLRHLARVLNKAFSYQLLITTALALFHIFFQAYYLYKTISSNDFSFITTSTAILRLANDFSEIYLIVRVCSNTISYANATPRYFHKLRNNVQFNFLEREISVYSLQMLHEHVEFTAGGFFGIDCTLISGVISAVTTYLVVFIQYDKQDEERCVCNQP